MSDGVAVQNLSHSWGHFALTNINLSVAQGSYFVLLGPTGSGKTLLLEAIVGAYRPREGNIIVDGEDVSSLPPEKRKISYAPQNYLLFDNMTVRGNVEFGLHAKGIAEEDRKNRTKHLLDLLGISHLANRFPRNLSGGERQRVSLARALVVEPRAVLLDEPLSAVDAATKSSILDYLRRVHKETGVTVIHVTHDQIEAATVADRIGVIKDGKMVQVGAPTDVIESPSTEVASMFRSENLFAGNVTRKEASLALVEIGDGKIIEAVTDRTGPVMLHIRPEEVVVSKHAVDSSARNRLSGTVAEVTDLGPTVRLRISGEKRIMAIITRRSFFEMQLNIGSEVHAIFKATSVEVL
ncbi:MAG: ABC transporter ATP-binding protein [Candidatus Bathyarchaeia archaeon]|jgi:molybdate/tungstate transport system ATP-binding protein